MKPVLVVAAAVVATAAGCSTLTVVETGPGDTPGAPPIRIDHGRVKDASGRPIWFTRFAPVEAEPGVRVVLAHGFLRREDTMHWLGRGWAARGIETLTVRMRHSRPWAGRHDRNAADLVAAARETSGGPVVFAGFSAGGLSALLAAADHEAAACLLLDPVDHRGTALAIAGDLDLPVFALLAPPSVCNARGNFGPVLDRIPDARRVEIPAACHCDFEGKVGVGCRLVCRPGPRTVEEGRRVRREILDRSAGFLGEVAGGGVASSAP